MDDNRNRLPPGSKVLRLADLRARGIVRSRTTLWRWVRAGTFPAPIELSARSQGWLESAVDDWLSRRPQKRVIDSGSAR